MSVVDHRASFVAHGHRGASSRAIGGFVGGGSSRHFEAPILVPSKSSGSGNDILSNTYPGSSGAFHSHSLRDLNKLGQNIDGSGRNKLRGLNTEAARELNASRRSLGGTARVGYGNVFDDNLGTVPNLGKPKSRRSLLGGVSYGAASVKRGFDPDLEAGGEPAGTISSSLGRSLPNLSRSGSISAGEGAWLVKRKSSKISTKTMDLAKKDSEVITPDVEEPPPEAAVAAPTKDKSKVKSKAKVKFAGKSNIVGGDSTSTKTNKVQFSTVSIRYYPTILGNNPFVTSGPPLELAWAYETSATENNIPVERFESVRGPYRRSEWDLALSRGERESRLLELGFTREEIAAAIRETSRIKAQRANTVLNLKMAGVEEFSDGMRRQTAKMVGLRKSSSWMYNEWKNKTESSPGNFSVTRADIILQQEQARRAKGSPDLLALQHSDDEKSKGGAFVNKLLHRPISPPKEREPIEEDESPRREFTGPAFGITQRSLSVKVGLGDTVHDNHSVAFGDNGTANSGAVLWPFALVKVVSPNSPASEAGLNKGDRILKLGNITALNHDHCRAIPELGQVAAAKECSIPMTVEDAQGTRRDITIKPHKWSGRGYFGFLLRELGTEMED